MKKLFITLLAIASSLCVFAQIHISGGNAVSSFVCDNGSVFAFGKNATIIGTGVLGIGGTADYYNMPHEVQMPVEALPIKQVNSGSGNHFVAVSCSGKVWSWGNNGKGQVGVGYASVKDGFVDAPTEVLAGVLSGTNWDDGSGFLTNVEKVYAGNHNSFAILDDKRLVGWGANGKGFVSPYDDAYGQLGNGNQIDQYAPVFVLDGQTGQPLQGVCDVVLGDNAAYALVDIDGDGIGTLYTWGYGAYGTLARNTFGTTNPNNSETVTSEYAYPAYYEDGTVIGNIVAIGAGDVFGEALDTEGYVWTWGNGAWNNATGSTASNYTGSNPRRVLAGTTIGASNDGTYLLAKAIGGGQGYGMAVTIDGKPVAWGGGGCLDGGATGNGTLNGSSGGVEYIQYASGLWHDDVIDIFRGDMFGWYLRSDGTVWGWGCNERGELGIGNNISQSYATQMNPPQNCSFGYPQPIAYFQENELRFCEAAFETVELNSGFVVSEDMVADYSIKWYKDEVLVASGNNLESLVYNATSAGVYMVEVSYVGTNASCGTNSVTDTISISFYEKQYTIPDNVLSCQDTIRAYAIPDDTNSTALYGWFASDTSANPVAKSVGSDTIDILISTSDFDSQPFLYVEELAQASGTVLSKSEGCDTTWSGSYKILANGNADPIFHYSTGVEVSQPIVLQKLSFIVKTSMYTIGEGSATIQLGVYGSKPTYYGDVLDDTKLYGQLSGSFSRSRTNYSEPTDSIFEVQASGELLLEPGIYFIGIVAAEIENIATVYVSFSSCFLSENIIDDISGEYIKYKHIAYGGDVSENVSGYFYNVKFASEQGYCERIVIPVEQCFIPITDIEINPHTLILNTNSEPTQLEIVLTPTNTTTDTVIWTSNDELVAVVDSTGLVSPIGEGECMIIATSIYDSSIADTCIVTIDPYIAVTLVSLDKTDAQIIETETLQLIPTISPANATNTEVVWTSSNVNVITVTQNGLVTAVSQGSAYVMAKSLDGEPFALCDIVVTPGNVAVTGVNLVQSVLSLDINETSQLTYGVFPSNATDKSVSWSTSDVTIASVDNSGIVTAVGVGYANIYVTTTDGEYVDTCKVAVTSNISTTVSLSVEDASIYVGSEIQIVLLVTPTDTEITWTSSDESIASVSSNGFVTAISEGIVEIRATANNGSGVSDIIVVTVMEPITILTYESELEIHKTALQEWYSFHDFFYYSGAGTVTYEIVSNDISVVTFSIVEDEFMLIPYGAGETTITLIAHSEYGAEQTATITITVIDDSGIVCSDLVIQENVTPVTCNGASNGSVELTVTNGVAPYSYKWSTGTSGNAIYNKAAGTYSVIITDDLGCSDSKEIVITEPFEISIDPIITNPQCGALDGAISIDIYGGTSPYIIHWSNGFSTTSISDVSAGVYTATITDSRGCESLFNIELNNSSAPEIIVDSILQSNCNNPQAAIYVSVIGGETPYTYKWNDGYNGEDKINVLPGVYTLTVTDDDGCKATISQEISPSELLQPVFGIVTIDKQTGNNLCVWQKEQSSAIDYYTIYREGIEAGVYEEIATIPYSDTSVYEDIEVDPLQQSYRYKISLTDVCGNESILSKESKTIHLQQNIGLNNVVNLDWDDYEGVDFSTYVIFRYTAESGEIELDRLPSSITRYTDSEMPEGYCYYYVAIILPDTLNPMNPLLKSETGAFSLAMSNIVEVGDSPSSFFDISNNNIEVIQTSKMIIISVKKQVSLAIIQLYAIDGSLVFSSNIETENNCSIPINILSKGVYSLVVSEAENIYVRRILIK